MSKLAVWDNTTEYNGYNCEILLNDLKECNEKVELLDSLNLELKLLVDETKMENCPKKVKVLGKMTKASEELSILLQNLFTWNHCELSLDTTLKEGHELQFKLQNIGTSFGKSMSLYQEVLARGSKDLTQAFLDSGFEKFRFSVEQSRKYSPWILSVEQEDMLTSLSTDGHNSFKKL